jgi:hypothetical protein
MPGDKTRRSLCARRCQGQGEIAPARTRRRPDQEPAEGCRRPRLEHDESRHGARGKKAIRSLAGPTIHGRGPGMVFEGRTRRFDRGLANGRNRRICVVAARSGEGPLSNPICRPWSSCIGNRWSVEQGPTRPRLGPRSRRNEQRPASAALRCRPGRVDFAALHLLTGVVTHPVVFAAPLFLPI